MPNKERDLLADLKICEEATPGPWQIASTTNDMYLLDSEDNIVGACHRVEDADFVVAAREGWPYAIRQALEAKAQRDALKVERDALEKTANEWFLELVEVRKEREELRKIVSSECPVDALDIANSLRVEKWHMQERIAELEAEVERLKAQIEETKDEVSAWKKIALGFDKFREG